MSSSACARPGYAPSLPVHWRPFQKAGQSETTVMVARSVAHFITAERTVTTTDRHGTATDVVNGELFFASSNDPYTQFDYALDPELGVIDMHASHRRDASTIAVLDAITEKYHHHGKDVKIIGFNGASGRHV